MYKQDFNSFLDPVRQIRRMKSWKFKRQVVYFVPVPKVFLEQFRDALGKLVSTREKGSIGPDVIIQSISDSGFIRIFDLKTHGGIERLISSARQNKFLRRFGAFAEEIFRRR